MKGGAEYQKQCCYPQEGAADFFKGSGEFAVEEEFPLLRFPVVLQAKISVTGELAIGKFDACDPQDGLAKGTISGSGALGAYLGQEITPDIKTKLVSITGTGGAKTEWTKVGAALVVMGVFEVEGDVNLLEFSFFSLKFAGFNLKMPVISSDPIEVYRKDGVFGEK